MRPDARFAGQPREFWANIRSISEAVGYTTRKTGQVKVPTLPEMLDALVHLGVGYRHLLSFDGTPTALGETVLDYFQFRADLLNQYVEPRLMDADRAREVFDRIRASTEVQCPIPMNKQKGAMKNPAYLTGIVNLIVASNIGGHLCDFDPRQLTAFTREGHPLRTLARRVDGAFPGATNPLAIWEVKEYYYTTTFGSRVADGVYESLLDGMELAELREHEGIDVKHYLMVDSRYTWWECGRSYLCRIVDMLHMGYLDEALFGYEVVERLPEIVRQWRIAADARSGRAPAQ